MLKRPITRLELAIVLALLIGAAVYAVQVNALYDFIEIGAPANPAANNDRLYANSGTHQLACLTSSGGSCMPSGGGGSFIQTLTAPVSGNFTAQNFNVGAGVTTTQVNNSSPVTSITIRQQDPNSTNNLVALAKSKVAATFTITEAFSIAGDVAAGPIAGIWLDDGGSPPQIILFAYLTNNQQLVIVRFNNYTGFNSAPYAPNIAGAVPTGPLAWMRVQETMAARNYYVSSDGINFSLVRTEANNAFFTTSRYGWGLKLNGSGQGDDAMITNYSFAESTP